MKQIKNKFGILGESHGQDRKHKEITIFKNPAENQQRNKENNILEVLGQALRKQKTCRKQTNISELFLESPPNAKTSKKPKKTKKKQYFRTLLESPQMPRPRKNQKKQKKQKKKNNISELFLSHPKCQDLEKNKKKKKQYFRTLSEDTPKSKTSGKLFFLFFFLFFLVFCRFLSRALKYCFFCFFFGFFLVFCRVFGFLPEGLSQDLQNIAFFISIWFSAGLFQFSFSRCPLLVL